MPILQYYSKFKTHNQNIQLVLISSALIAVGRGVILGTVFSVFVKAIGGTNESLGFLSTFGGIIMTITLFSTGFFTDKVPRQKFIKLGSIFTVFGFVLFIISNDLLVLFIGQGLFSISMGLTRPSIEALTAVSVESGKRESIYAEIYFTRQFFNAVGPALAVILFFILGDLWDIEIMRQVIAVGSIFTFLGVFYQYKLNDKYSLGSESESMIYSSTRPDQNLNTNGSLGYAFSRNYKEAWWFVPLSLIGLGFIVGLGAGMTVRFFPIFFKEVYSLPPTVTNVIFTIAAVLTGLVGLSSPRIAKKIGKIETMFLVQFIAILCLLIIALIPPFVIVFLAFIWRGAFMNASQPIQKSILMDLTPKANRGMINALQVLTFGFLWSMSAGIGGILLDRFNFSVLYYITVVLYIIGTFPILLLRPYLKKEKSLEKIIF